MDDCKSPGSQHVTPFFAVKIPLKSFGFIVAAAFAPLLAYDSTADVIIHPNRSNSLPPVQKPVNIVGQNYYAVDISGSNASSDVTALAINDSDSAAYLYSSSTNAVQVKTWTNGATVLKQTLSPIAPAVQQVYLEDNGNQSITRTLIPMGLTSSGVVYGNIQQNYLYYGNLQWVVSGFQSSSGSPVPLNGFSFPPPNSNPLDGQYINLRNILGTAFPILINAETGYAGTTGSGLSAIDWQPISGEEHGVPYVDFNGAVTYPPGYPGHPGLAYAAMSSMNDIGQAIGAVYPGQNYFWVFWDGTKEDLLPAFPAEGVDVNNSGQVVGETSFPDDPQDDGYLWQVTSSGTNYTTIKTMLASTVYAKVLPEWSYITPVIISNANPLDQSVSVLFTALVDGTSQDFVLKMTPPSGMPLTIGMSSVTLNLSTVQVPSGTDIADYVGMNAYGIISALGSPSGATTQHAFLLVPMSSTIFSNQIAGVKCNKLPTGLPYIDPVKKAAHVVSDFNNPMIMAATSGSMTNLLIVFSGLPPQLLPGLRVGVMQAGASDVLASAAVQSGSAGTPLQFQANDGRQKYQVVFGYDANGDGILDINEIQYVYAGTGGDSPATNQDKIVDVTQNDYNAACAYLTPYGAGTAYFGGVSWFRNAVAFTKTFLDSTKDPLCSSKGTFTLYSNDPELKHPLGANWVASGSNGMATANVYNYDNTTLLSQEVASSNSIASIILGQLALQKNTVLQYFANNPNASTYTSPTIAYAAPNFSFSTLDPHSDVFYSLGSIDNLQGQFQFTATKLSIVGIERILLTSISYSGSLSDLADFYYFADKNGVSQNGATAQAGYPTLGNSGRVFKTTVTFSIPNGRLHYSFQ